ncbi:PIN domain-containing protein [Luteolibacter sp.]|uniref:PIN domain-containing protein n=1 Tax=Luteolibacter sp. TaxID=1962973 RepID=UPI0032630704
MRADIFLDTNILLYAASRDAAGLQKREKARELLGRENVGLSVQVLAEFFVNATGKLKLPEDKVAAVLESFESYPILPVTEAIFWAALVTRRRYQISYWDAAIIAAAAELGCHTIFSEDLNHGQIYDGVRVLNPFAD